MAGRVAVVALLAVGGCRYGFDEAAVEDACAARPDAPALVPSNGVTADMLCGATATLAGADLQFDTDTGEIVGLRPPGGGMKNGIGYFALADVGVFVARDITVPSGGMWTATGRRAWILYAETTITVSGTIDAGSTGTTGGPGGTDGGIGGARTLCEGGDGRFKFSNTTGAGAGGGGGRTAGGGGAPTAADGQGATLGGAGGTACAPPRTIPLRGGNGGGAGGTENMIVMGGAGGGGGGALALVAMTQISIDGVVASPGAGGETIASGKGGGGGGGGGAILLESPAVTVTGRVTTEGGAGGAAINGTSAAMRGERGHTGDATAATGASGGGNGGTGAIPPAAGATLSSGAGGGGAAGAIEVKTLAEMLPGLVDPAPSHTQATVE